MQTDRLGRADETARAQSDAPVRILGVQDAGPEAWQGIVVGPDEARGRFVAHLGPNHLTLTAFGVTRTMPRLDTDPAWLAQEPCIVLGLALIVSEV
jgi:hypothetical protein